MSKFKKDENGNYVYNETGWNPYPDLKPIEEGMYRILHTGGDGVVFEDVVFYRPPYDGFLLLNNPDEHILAFKRCKYDFITVDEFERIFKD